MTRRLFFQAIPGVLPLCHPSDQPPLMSLTWPDFEQVNMLLQQEIARLAALGADTVAFEKSRGILRVAVRERGTMNREGQ